MVCTASAAYATKLPELNHRNTEGGEHFDMRCDDGEYLIGFVGRAGAWIDNMAIICARWNERENAFGAPAAFHDLKVGMSDGGESKTARCPAGWIARSVTVGFSNWEDSGLLHTVELHCAPMVSLYGQKLRVHFGSTRGWGRGERSVVQCPYGEALTGIHGRAGMFVDAIGFICGETPAVVDGTRIRSLPIETDEPTPAETKRSTDDMEAPSPAETKRPTDTMEAPAPAETRRRGGVMQQVP